MRYHSARMALAGLAALAALAALILALFDWRTTLVLLAALALGWAFVAALVVGAAVYRRHRGVVLGVGAAIVLVLAVVFRPDGSVREEPAPPLVVSGYGAELWPNRLAAQGTFILRERLEGIAESAPVGADGRANLDPIATGPLMRELRFVPGAGSGASALELDDGGEAVVVVNPIEAGEVHHARGGSVSRVQLPLGPVVRVELDDLSEARVAYLVGAGRALSPIASLVTPLRRMPPAAAILLFALIGALAAHAWSDRVVTPLGRRFTGSSKPPAAPTPGQPVRPVERAPLVPRRK